MNVSYPLEKKGTVTSGFGPRWGRNHNGIDIGISDGTSVRSIQDGKVVRSDMVDKNGYGNFIIIEHDLDGQKIYSAYAHLTKRLVNVGDTVKKGEEIAKSGGGQGVANGAGSSTGPHLHFEIRKSITGNWVNPAPYLTGEILLTPSTGSNDESNDGLFGDIDWKKMGGEAIDFFKNLKDKIEKKYQTSNKEMWEQESLNESTKTSNKLFSSGTQIKIISRPSDHAKRSTADWSSRDAWDIQAPIGTPVYSLTKGKVIKKHESSGKKANIFGTQLSISGKDGYPSIFYTHLESVDVNVGDNVEPGDYIGKITKWPTYPTASHVHIGIDGKKDIFQFMDQNGKIKNYKSSGSKESEQTPKDDKEDETNLDKENILNKLGLPKIDFNKFGKNFMKVLLDLKENKKELTKTSLNEEVEKMKDLMKKIQ
jgi:murein DD-endopeptidase MepM/ murein hydrolase activator NlpD